MGAGGTSYSCRQAPSGFRGGGLPARTGLPTFALLAQYGGERNESSALTCPCLPDEWGAGALADRLQPWPKLTANTSHVCPNQNVGPQKLWVQSCGNGLDYLGPAHCVYEDGLRGGGGGASKQSAAEIIMQWTNEDQTQHLWR